MSVELAIGWFTDTGEFCVNAPNMTADQVVYLLEHAKKKVLDNVSPDRNSPPKKLIDPVRLFKGNGDPH